MKLLISVVDAQEAKEAFLGGADIVDVKRPSEGSLGACPPNIIRSVREALPQKVEVSAAVGDVPDLPGTVSLAALGAAVSGVDYVKVGVYGPKSLERAVVLLKEVKEAVKSYDSSIKVVAASYADYGRAGCLEPNMVLEAARKAEVDVWMIDTKVKDGSPLLSFLSPSSLISLIERAHGYGMIAAVAGSLKLDDLEAIGSLGADVVGFRGAACGGDRVKGRVRREFVEELKRRLSLVR
ncbi:MAG: hypothetical protein DRJ98_03850 [Thermoprotei archaeon]|nr:MAG: hypothetical protein DRJ98_03850 [Thermoprotei archaeon]RLF17425.1 MAG: hypothetical protein DRN06_03865 [Thermoprotei archaeon]